MEILSHVNKRVKHHPEIGLPLVQLWSMYREFSGAPMVRNFCVVYIEMAFDRMPVVVSFVEFFCSCAAMGCCLLDLMVSLWFLSSRIRQTWLRSY